ncbi:hypothetical protein PGH46_17750 [Legionella pneumophila]|nr:hypothetical protein PGH46_17750 [Legionella pneumophila]
MIKHATLISGLIVSFLASAAEMSFLAQLTEVPGASGYKKCSSFGAKTVATLYGGAKDRWYG